MKVFFKRTRYQGRKALWETDNWVEAESSANIVVVKNEDGVFSHYTDLQGNKLAYVRQTYLDGELIGGEWTEVSAIGVYPTGVTRPS